VLPLSLLAGIVVYAATATERFPTIVLAVGAAGLVVNTVALAGGWPSILPVGLVGVAAAYAVFLAFRSESVDPWAPFVAAALLAAAELAFTFLEPLSARPSRALQARQLLTLGAGALGTAIFGSGLLLVAGEGGSSVALDAAGILAAVAAMAVVAGLAVRRATQDAPSAGQTSRAVVTTFEDGMD
jgi:hypothetical protein